jgi:hypothetical protein
MATYRPRIGEVENRRMTFGRLGAMVCVRVAEDGLPPGRSVGSFISRTASFRLDLGMGRATPVQRCS